jgi:hypothetical protein
LACDVHRLQVVIAGLYPAIHLHDAFFEEMDMRVKPAYDVQSCGEFEPIN